MYVVYFMYLCTKYCLTTMKNTFSPYKISALTLSAALLIVIVSVLFTNNLARQLEQAEQQKMLIWAEATEMLIQAAEDEDVTLISDIIASNTTIPVYMLDDRDSVLATRNVEHIVHDITALHGPIKIELPDGTNQSIYYEDSTLLLQLKWFPYIEFGIIVLFVLIAVVTLRVAQRSEQDRVWAGLSKETAHQLGTPISSLNAWQELLEERYPEDDLIPEMRQDIVRLQTIAERFSKIGSLPNLESTSLLVTVNETVAYMRSRLSDKVTIQVHSRLEGPDKTMLNKPLFSWVLENLLKNAVDAMNGVGSITVTAMNQDDKLLLDITDNGKGMDRRIQRQVFRPGFTGKTRGWGLGLSLAKRIVEDYHGGRLTLQSSQVGVGTTFRISLEQTENS